MNGLRHSPLFLALLRVTPLTAALSACAPEGDGTAVLPWDYYVDQASDTDDGIDTDDTGDSGDSPYTKFGIKAVTEDGILNRIADSTGAECEITPDGTPEGYVRADCTLDIAELDLYGHGLQLDLAVGEGLCDYLVYDFYKYEVWEVGTGPTDVSYTITPEGTIADEVNSVSGTPYCSYDYEKWTSPAAPNCCIGTYTLTVRDETVDPVEVRTTTNLSWDGVPSSCYGGAAFLYPSAAFAEDGFPLDPLLYLDGAAYADRVEWDALSSRYYSNIPLANYYEAADHGGTKPAGLTGDRAQDDYAFYCYDHAEELLAEIHLDVREWNEVSEWEAVGNPDSTGTEPQTGEPLDDRDDWATGTPGDDVWIEFAQ